MKIYLATGNLNKKKEMSEILTDFTVVIPSDEGINFDPEETGTTFYENSLIKARALWEIVHCPVIADDSGICVDALNGIPGVYSSRYAGPDFPQGRPDKVKIPQAEQNRLLIEQTNEALKNKKAYDSPCPAAETAPLCGNADSRALKIPNGKLHGENGHFDKSYDGRSCRYVCSMVLFLSKDRFFVAQETMEGRLVKDISESAGTGGFGYDPIFFLPQYGCTAAQLTAEQKNAISHRGKAVQAVKKIFPLI
ncbi:non-canonical purine NTP pyrophosphatase [Treponema parvum]|uniref:dITP/XTP pyrophosphatase n=1 Tax=Treponema parvum TaxID=138851 RepID=A0A975EZK4_9SPIR|nr:non-canonical purine NTP pyrophosphatase [Treponema parvum]QTQ11643.1 non-canonical purine NTP pyrophosphatase [Treponema parvum]